ncbi:MFS transporter [Arthrobacter sp.]|uniref:MFS transporter n=1 Tax=Arthrobacter sp. TaxID=1667 RepID=UPI0028A12EC4|nr:MFS transporter [Arthrobacter sp.]
MGATATTPYRWRWLILGVMLTAEIMDLLDSTIVNVAGPDLERSLGASALGLQWVIGGYALTLGAGLILGGRLGDRFGRRPMFLASLLAFTIVSLLCALAPSIEVLIAFRLMQGVAGAMLLPQGLGLLRENFSGKELGQVFGVFGPVLGLGGILGPIIGGGLIEANLFGLGWRAVFLVNVPIGLAALIVAWRILPRRAGDKTVGVDVVGAAIIVVASALLVLPLNFGQEQDWPLWTWLSIVAGLGGFVAFAWHQRAAARHGRTPLVVPGIFSRRAYTLGLAGIALYFSALIGTQLILTLFLQIGQGFSAGEAGLGNLPVALGTAVGGALSGAFLAERLGRAVLQIGAVVQILGAAILWIELGSGGPFDIWQIVPGIAVIGFGSGLVIAALFSIILAAVKDEEIGSASGVLTAVQAIASSIGVAVFGSTFFSVITEGSPADAFRSALLIQAGLLVAFFVLTFLFPLKGRADEHGAGPDNQASPLKKESALAPE